MKNYEVQVKYYYGETSEYGAEIIRSTDKMAALREFAKRKGISPLNLKNYENWHWWEGVWLGRLKCIKSVD